MDKDNIMGTPKAIIRKAMGAYCEPVARLKEILLKMAKLRQEEIKLEKQFDAVAQACPHRKLEVRTPTSSPCITTLNPVCGLWSDEYYMHCCVTWCPHKKEIL